MRVLILEPHATGHYSSYLQWMTAGPIKRGLLTYVGRWRHQHREQRAYRQP